MLMDIKLTGSTRRSTKDQKAGGQARGTCRRDNRAEKSSQLCETRSADGEGEEQAIGELWCQEKIEGGASGDGV